MFENCFRIVNRGNDICVQIRIPLTLQTDILDLPAAVGFYKSHIKIKIHISPGKHEFIYHRIYRAGFKFCN